MESNTTGSPSTEEIFSRAVEYVSKAGHLKPSSEEKLRFYALYKQATLGPCSTSRPAFWDIVGKAKWDAWKGLKELSKEESMLQYTAQLYSLDPNWNTTQGVVLIGILKVEEVKGGGREVKDSGEGTGGPVFSLPERSAEEDTTPKDICYWASQGVEEEVLRLLQSNSVNVNWKDEEGRAALHYACDRELEGMVTLLLKHGADVNLKDGEGQTACHYAGLVENKKLYQLLMEHGADVNIKDNEGTAAVDLVAF